MNKVLCAVVALITLAGCASVTPALAGKTTYSQTFEDTEAASVENGVVAPGQTTKYTLNIKAPAGVKLDDITGMAYDWSATDGKIAINKSGTTDSTAQAQALIETNKQLTELVNASMQALISAAAPLVGQSIAGNQANEAARIQTQAAFRAQLVEALRELGVPTQPETPLTDVPVVP